MQHHQRALEAKDMTPEQLDEIEKLAVDFKSAAFHDCMARQALPLVKALREAREEWAYEWEQRHQMEVKLLATEAEVERLREAARGVHALAEAAMAGTAVGAWLQTQEIHKITKGMVE